MIISKEDELLASCGCESEVLRIQKIEDDYEFSIYSLFSRPSMRQSLRHIWRVIRYGTPYSDQVILKKSQMDELATWIQQGGNPQ